MSHFQLFSTEQIASLRRGGKVLADCLRHVASLVRPGMKTLELDRAAEEFIRSHDGAAPAFKGYRGFPGSLCTSVNDECVHGIPGPRILKQGDIIALDCGVLFDGLYTDACLSVAVGKIPSATQQFLDVTKDALDRACATVRPGTRIGDISSTIQGTVEGAGYSCVKALTGHGLGTTLHQFPDVPNTGEAGTGPILPAWTLIAIEPITAIGKGSIKEGGDGWTIATLDGSLSAHFEHTVLVTVDGYEIIA